VVGAKEKPASLQQQSGKAKDFNLGVSPATSESERLPTAPRYC